MKSLLVIIFIKYYSSPTGSPDFEGRGGDELAEKICRILSIAYDKSGAIDLKRLSITPKKYCYVIDVDILVSYTTMADSKFIIVIE